MHEDILSATAASPAKAKVVSSDQFGGLVEIPIAAVAQELDLSRTASRSKGKVTLSRDDLAQMVENFRATPQPVRVDPHPHRSDEEAGGPAPGFVESLSLRGDQLWAKIRLIGTLFGEFVQGMWRGFSIDAEQDRALPTATLKGWSIKRGVLTNSPALDTVSRVDPAQAAEAFIALSLTIEPEADSVSPVHSKKEVAMSDTITLVAHESAVAELKQRLGLSAQENRALTDQLALVTKDRDTYRSKADELSASIEKFRVERDAARVNSQAGEASLTEMRKAKDALQARVVQLAADVEKLQTESLAEKVKVLVLGAIEKGVPPALFEGWEAEPATWLRAKYASLEAFEDLVTALTASTTPMKGQKPQASAVEKEKEKTASLTENERRVFERLRLTDDVFSSDVTDVETARRLYAERKKKEN